MASGNSILTLAVLLSTLPVQAQVIHTVAGGGPPNGIVATSASIAGYSPAVDTNGNVYFSSGEAVYQLNPTGHLTRVAGQTIAGAFPLALNGNACPTAANIGDGGPATSALLNNPQAVAVDAAGNLYIADSFSCRVRVVNMQASSIKVLGVTIAAGDIATVAGTSAYGYNGDNIAATSAQLYQPSGVAVDSSGNLYIADTANSRVRMVNTSGTITTLAGNGTRGCTGDGLAATSAELKSPVGVAADATGNIYIADDGGCNVRVVSTQASSTTVLGVTVAPNAIASVAGDNVQGYNNDGIAATTAEISLPRGVALDSSGDLYIADTGNNRIRMVSTSGTISTVAGNGTAGYSGDNGPATSAEIATPFGVALDASRDLYIADESSNFPISDYHIRMVTSGGTISTVAGNGNVSYSGDGQTATGAQFYNPSDVATDAAGNLYIADSFNNVVRAVNTQSTTVTLLGVTIPPGDVATVAGNESLHNCSILTNECFGGDGGPATSAELDLPEGVALDGAGNLYIADAGNARVREVNLNGIISTVAGNGMIGDQNGPATGTALNFPLAVAVDGASNVYIADYYGNVVREVNTQVGAIQTYGGASIPAGYIATVAGNGTGGYNGDGISALSAELNGPTGIAIDPNYNLYIADNTNARLREVEVVSGTITTVAGNGTAGYSGDGGAATSAELDGPFGVTSDLFGNLYIADYSGVRVVNTQSSAINALGVTIAPGDIETVAGNGTLGFSGDGGAATSAMIDGVQGTALDLGQNLYIADFENLRIRKVNAPQNPTAPNFTLTTTTPIQSVAQGGDSATYVVTIASVNGFSGTVSINAVIDPYMGYQRPATVTLTPGGSQNFNFVITSKLSPSGTFPVTVVGTTASGLVSTLPLQLIVDKPALTPTVTVTPSPSSITTAQADTVTVTVNGGSGNPTPTGSVTLTSGNYTSGAVTLSGGSAMINIPAGSLAVGMDTLTANYSPDQAGGLIYANAMGTNTVTVTNGAAVNPGVYVSTNSSIYNSVEAISGYVNVGTGTGRTPTGTVVVTAGSYSSGPLALSIGEAAYSIPAGTLALGTDTISASYTPDSSSTPFFTASSGTTSVQVLTGSLIYPKFQASIPSPTILTTSVTPITFALSSAFAPTVNFSPITPTGTITLSSGAYTSPPMPIAAPSSSIAGFASGSIPAGTLAVGPHTLTATYTPDAAGSAYYTSVSTTLQVTVITPPATNTSWTWEGGNSALYSLPASSPVTQIFTNFFVVGLAGSYGTPGVSSTSNLPGSRSGASSWTDRTGNFWLFGGNGVDSADNSGSLNDLWSFNPSNMQWTWVAGASSVANISSTACTQQGFCGSPGVYGMRGTGASGNTPGSRTGQMSWTDSAGNFWLYGGNGPDSASNFGVLNDLWEFSPTQKVWAWVGGNSTFSSCPYQGGCSVLAVYGTLGTPSSTTTPGNRQYASTWTDLNGNLWLFGGEGYGTDSYLGTFNDLWKFSPSTGQWTWVAGTSGSCDSSNKCGAGVYGTLGTAASGNNPGARIGATSWTDTNGNLWLFGGSGMDANGTNTSLNDLWEFSPSTELWTWQGGTNIVGSISGVKGIYGTQGVASSGNIPGGRSSAQGWTDASGNFWLFGGSGTDASGLAGVILNDLWEYSPSTKQWTWQQGSSTAPPETYLQNYNIGYNGGQPGVYGTLGSSAAGNIPGARSGLVEWTDSIGNFWLFGGEGDDANSLEGPLNDLWKYQLSASTAPDFTITTLTPTMTVSQAGNGATFMVTITPLNGFSGQIALGVCCDSALGVTVPASITIPSNGTAQNFNFTITSAPQLGVGTFSETVTGETVGGLQHGLTLNLVVQNPGLTPAVTVTPTSSSITTAQADMVTVTVNGGSGNPVATGSVTLTSGTYTSGAVTLSGGSAMINIPAGSLAAGPDTLTASYTPDSNSSSIYNGAMGSNTVTVTTVVSAPVAGLAPSPVTFTGQVAGTISQPMTVTLSNTGNAALTGITPSLTGINPSDFAITTGTNACGSSLAAGANCSIYVIFTPASAASFTATLSVADNASGSPQTATLNGTGVSFVSNVGTAEAAQMVTVPITTAGMLSSIQALTLGAPNLDFAATPGGTCEGGTAYTVGQSCTVNVIFTPKYSGTRWGAVVLSNASGSVLGTTYLPGTGLGPQLAFRFSNNISSYTSASGSFNGVAVDASGDIFIAGSADVTEIPAGCLSATCYISIGGGNLSNLQSMAVDGSGNLYVSNSNPSLVMEIPRGCTSSSCAITLGGGFTSPYAVAVDGNGNVYVADSYNNAVKMMPPGCLSSSCVTKLGGGFFVTQGITVDGKGNVYVADDNLMVNNSGSIKEMPPGCLSSACVTTLLANLPDPQGLAVDAAGDVYFTQVVPDDAGAYEMLAVGGSIPSSPTVVPLITPFEGQGVAVDGPGNVYLVSGSSLFKQDAVDPPGQIFETPTNVGSQDDDDDPLTVTAQNIGNMSLTFTGIAPATNFPIDAPSTNCSTSSPLVEGGTCDVGVDFAPTAAGPLSGNVILTDNNLNVAGSTQPIALSGTGVAVLGPPTASLSPGPLNFGGVQIETTSPALIETVTNTGGGSVSISGVSIAQTGTNAFFLGTGANQCTNTTSLSNAQSCNVYVTFNPSLNGHTYNATLDIADNASGSPQTASLTGVGDYFNQDVGNSTSKEPVSVFITTGGTLSATNVVTTGAQTPDYTLQTGGTCAIGTAYSAGQVCTVDVIFVPQFSGARNGAIYLTTSSGAVLGTTFLQGTGNAPQIIFGPVAPQTAIGYITGLAGVAVDAAGDLFYVNGSDRLIEAPVSGPAVTVANLSSLISDGTPSNVAIDPSGNLFVASNSEAPLIEVPSTGPGTWGTPVSINTGVGNVAQVAVDSFGNLYITAPAQNTVYQLPFTGSGYGTPVALPFPGSGAFKPQGVAVDPSLDVYAIGQNASNATELIELPNHGTSYGTPVTTLIAQLTYGGGVGTDGNGDVYVSGQTAATKGAIYFVPASGSPVLVGTGFYFAFALDSVSNIYVVQANFSDQAEIVEIPQATPPSLTFATTAVGTTSADSPKTVTVTNVGNEALDFYASSSYPTDFPENSSDSKLCNAEFPLNPGAECDVSVNFTPTTSGPLSEDVTLKDENLNNGSSTQLIPVSGTGGAAVVPIAGLAPSPVTFTGQVQGTTSLPMAVTLSNTGSAALTGITPSITGTNPGDFAIGTGANACGTSLAANSSCSIYVTFTPAGTGGFSATLSVADDASVSPQTATLNGTGVSFVSNVGTAEAAQTVTVPITTAGTLGSIQVLTQGISSLDFTTATGGTCTTGTAYTVGQSCTVNVIFNPRSPGPRRGAVQLLDGSGNLLATAFLPGVGTSPQDIFAITTSGSFVPAAQETILAGSVGSSAYTLSFPYDVAVDAAGNVYTADQGSNQINKWTATGGLIPSGATPTALGFGNGPEGIAVDGAGNVFASIWNVTAVQMLQAQGGYTTVTNICPGCFPSSVADGGAAGIAVDGYGNLFVAGYGSSKVYELSPTNGYSTATAIGSGFNFPQGVAVDSNGNVFVADYGNNAVKEILAPAYTTVVTLESNQGSSFFNHPIRLAVDAADNVWVADYANSVVKELLASSGYTTYNTIGGTYSHPYGVALDAAGNLLIADPNNHAVQDLLFSQPPTLTFASTNVSSTSTDSPKVVAVSNIGNASLDFSLSTDPAYPTDFPENSSGTNLCVSASPLASGGICNVSVNFKPTTSGLLSEDVVLTDNDLNGSGVTQSIPVSGTGLSSLIAQTITFTQPTTPVTYSSGLVIPLSATGGASGNPVILTLDPGSSYTGTYILTGSSLTIASAGTYVIDANQAGNSTYSAAPQVQRTVVVSQATQTITFAQPTTPVTYSAGLTIPLSATGGASGNSVIFSIDASSTGTGSISGSQVIVTSAGTFVIDANQAGNTNYSAAPQVQRTVVVNAPGAQAITFTQPTSPVTYSSGLQITLTATGGASGNPVVFTIDGSSTGSGSISGSTLTVTTVGSFTIDANQAGNSSYSAAPQVQRTVVVSQATQTINFTQPTSPVIYSGTSVAVPLSATGGASGNVVVFTIDASSTATGSISGSMLTVTSTGNLVIDANQAGNTDYSAAAQVQRTVVVNTPNSQTIVFTQPATPVTYSSGLAIPLAATGGGSGNSVVFSIDASSTGTGTISGSTLTVTSAGSFVIDANQAGNATYSAAPQVQRTVQVTQASQTINFTQPTSPVIYSGTSVAVPLSATGGASGNAVVFTIDASSTATGSISGSTLTVTSTGNLVIDANQAGNTNYSAATQVQRTVAVNAPIAQAINFTQPTTPVTYSSGLTIPLSASGGASENPVVFTIDSSSTGAGTISGSTLTVTSAGSFVIDANQAGNSNYSAAPQVQKTVVVSQAAQVINFTQPATPVTYSSGLQITLSATGGASGNAVVFTIDASSTGAGTISGSTLTVTKAGNLVIDANQAGNTDYSAAPQVQHTVAVNAPAPDFSVAATPPSQSVTPGNSVMYPITVADVGSAFTSAVTLSVSGLPTGATGAFNPASVTPGSEGASSTLTVTIPNTASLVRPNLWPAATPVLALLFMLPFRRWRKVWKGKLLLLVAGLASLACAATFTGCGGGFGFIQSQTYTLTITGTSGSDAHSTTVQLTVQ